MKERPILFSGPMVRAILDGRKTQTRRALGWPVLGPWIGGKRRLFVETDLSDRLPEILPLCRYGQPGDRLWVRETWGLSRDTSGEWLRFAAGGGPLRINDGVGPRFAFVDDGRRTWRPSIHMPRWASRITLEIESIRVEQLQDISEEDAKAEGVEEVAAARFGRGGVYQVRGTSEQHESARAAFSALWVSISGPESWDANPWVWVLGFKLAEQKAVAHE